MASEISKTQIDRLGDRLKKGNITDEDLRVLDEYRRSFTDAYETVVGIIRSELLLQPTGRPAKSTTSISEKLRRESIRLTQMQDIAGCRVIVTEISNQEEAIRSLMHVFAGATISDRRAHPSHGYRAVHVIVNRKDKPVEIQIRTSLQHAWAELSEKLSDMVDPAIKYGGGDPKIQETLTEFSGLVADHESLSMELTADNIRLSFRLSQDTLTDKREEVLQITARTEDRDKKLTLLRQRFEQIGDAMQRLHALLGEN